jgi:hypothetical protein
MTANITIAPTAAARSEKRMQRVDRTGATRPSPVHLVATTLDGTRAALVAAGAIARGSGAPAVMLVPWVVPYAESLDHPTDSVAFGVKNFRKLAEELGIDVAVHVCLCRSSDDAIASLVPRDAVVVIGGRGRLWWPTREQRLAARLSRSGHRVVFVAEAHGHSTVNGEELSDGSIGRNGTYRTEAWRG